MFPRAGGGGHTLPRKTPTENYVSVLTVLEAIKEQSPGSNERKFRTTGLKNVLVAKKYFNADYTNETWRP